MWGKICRICASPGSYEIFANIPIYLHASCKEYANWQKPINEIIEETTGLKVSADDGLPKNICALCISYLKHAKTFRDQAINTCLNFLAVKEYKNIVDEKCLWNYDKIMDEEASAQQLNNYDDDNLKSQSKYQNKVSKQLMSNTSINATPSLSKQIQLSLQYLSKLYETNKNAGTSSSNSQKCQEHNNTYKSVSSKQRRQYSKSIDIVKTGSGGSNSKRLNLEDDLPRTTSSDEYETPEEVGTGHIKNNIFSYKEKNFEEDDIMDLDELKDAITINIPSTCKEHKCSFCFKRFMFEESFEDHIRTCIEYKFATFLEEMNNLLQIRYAKEISPHEFIRRMIFSLRKTCEWLKENCIDTTLPDLLQNNQNIYATTSNQRLESKSKYSAFSVEENILQKISHNKLNKTLLANSPILTLRPTVERITPINISNNILYEIERSESRNSQKMLKKPIPILATSSAINTANCSESTIRQNTSAYSERLAFIEKLQNAAKPIVPVKLETISTPVQVKPDLKSNNLPTPLISVRRDLLAATATTNNAYSSTKKESPLLDLLQCSFPGNSITPVTNPCARCPQCNLYFETLESLEIHNAVQHNSLATKSCTPITQTQSELDSERKHIIALFEDDDDI